MHTMARAWLRTRVMAGSKRAARMAMIETTTSSSIRVNPIRGAVARCQGMAAPSDGGSGSDVSRRDQSDIP